ncbi:CaiB/BaiF CoA transferase family protein [Chloroflexota bacterium]
MSGAFDGLKVADFSWAIAGPLVTRYLADHGAMVIRVESSGRPCLQRISAPYKDGIPGINRSGYFAFFNANKYSIDLNLNNAKGMEVAKRLVAWADVVVENFSPGRMEAWGLGYDDLKSIKPDIIMLRSSNQGQSGPHANYSSTGVPLIGLAGFPPFIGWPDRTPLPIPVAYTDMVSPRFATAALIAALDYRRRTGKGQYIDISQFETGIQFLTPAVLDYVVNGREGERRGNASLYAAPHGAYRCQGDDRWCAIAVFTDEEWKSFCKAISNPPWTENPKFSTLRDRKENEDELNRLVEEYTINFTAEEVMTAMQSAGVAAGVIEDSSDLLADPQLKHRGYFLKLTHHEIGPMSSLSQSFRLSKTPAEAQMPAPCLGEHTDYVRTEILGISDEEFVELLQAGAFN